MSVLNKINENASRGSVVAGSNVTPSKAEKTRKSKIAKISRRINRTKRLTAGQKKVVAKLKSDFVKKVK